MAERIVDAVVFDLGGVVMAGGSPDVLITRYPEHDPDLVRRIIIGEYGVEDGDHPWHQLERGEITYDQYRDHVKVELTAAGISRTDVLATERKPGESNEASAMGKLGPNHAMVELIEDLRAAGLATALLTNNVKEFRPRWWSMLPFEELFDAIVDSAFVGVRKPNPAIYELTLRQLGSIPPQRAAFLDDVVGNVDAARSLGWHGLHVVGLGDEAIARVRELAGLI